MLDRLEFETESTACALCRARSRGFDRFHRCAVLAAQRGLPMHYYTENKGHDVRGSKHDVFAEKVQETFSESTKRVRTPKSADTTAVAASLLARLRKPINEIDDLSLRPRVLVIDDQPLMRAAIAKLLKDNVVPAHTTCVASVEAAARFDCDAFDLILLDLNLPGYVNVGGLTAIREQRPHIPVVVFANRDDKPTILAALDAGAMGLIPKRYEADAIAHAIAVVLGGGVFVPPMKCDTPSKPPHEFKRRSSDATTRASSETQRRRASDNTKLSAGPQLDITPRQQQVLSLLIKGLCNKSICKQLALSENTVKSHISAIYRALGVNNRTAAVIAMSHNGYQMARSTVY
jgi:DNA-binding NarL/FixJ family response regulator